MKQKKNIKKKKKTMSWTFNQLHFFFSFSFAMHTAKRIKHENENINKRIRICLVYCLCVLRLFLLFLTTLSPFLFANNKYLREHLFMCSFWPCIMQNRNTWTRLYVNFSVYHNQLCDVIIRTSLPLYISTVEKPFPIFNLYSLVRLILPCHCRVTSKCM